jgi:hypothetical protein
VLVAGGVLGEVAGKMLVHDQFLVRRVGEAPAWAEATLRLGLALGIIAVGWLTSRRHALVITEA